MKRYLSQYIEEFSRKKFVFLAGPRQVGKTTAAKQWLENKNGVYLNWDDSQDRADILQQSFIKSFNQKQAILFDEIHKYSRWKNYIKGIYDKHSEIIKVVVTGSSRLDLFKKGGDSLFGRYELLRLHPLSIAELTNPSIPAPPQSWLEPGNIKINPENWRDLCKFGGFPEPFYEKNPLLHQRWSLRRRDLLIQQDLRELTQIQLLGEIEHLYLLLPEKIGSSLSINSLKEQLQVSYNSVASWLKAFEKLYICFRINPFHEKLSRSLKKEQKLYLWDWSQIENPAARFENIVASHLLKAVQAWTDIGYGEFDLLYWRNKEKQELDFVITNKRKPVAIFECKISDQQISKSFSAFATAFKDIPSIQLLAEEGIDYVHRNTRVISASNYLANLV